MVISSIYRGGDNAHLCNKKKQKKIPWQSGQGFDLGCMGFDIDL
jgi:hypothetical protein